VRKVDEHIQKDAFLLARQRYEQALMDKQKRSKDEEEE
jgi:hypothetical protein